jgi:hypothetical protein
MNTLSPHPVPEAAAAPFARKSGWGKWAIGCSLAALLFVLAAGLATWYVARNLKSIATNMVSSQIKQAVQQSALPADQKQRIVARVDTLAADFKADQITGAQLGAVFEAITKGPLLHLGAVYLFEQSYLTPSGLSVEEKAAGRRALERFARGVYEAKIPREQVEQVTDPVMETNAQNEREFKKNATDEDVREALARAQTQADQADMPDESFTVNVADEFEQAVAAALAKPTEDQTHP